jgi:hypothetical protein
MEFHDKTLEKDNPLFVFWRQQPLEGHWVTTSLNLLPFLRLYELCGKVRVKLIKIFSKDPRSSKNNEPFQPIRASAFSLPSDFDDSALNWSLGFSLYKLSEKIHEPWLTWSSYNFKFEKLAKRTIDCAYRPFANDNNLSVIDPRSFFAIREFLWNLEANKRGTPDFALLTTWASTINENRESIQRHYKMPFNVNNLDCCVQANFLYAASKSVFYKSFPDHVQGFTSLIANTAELLAWGIESGTMVDQPDLLLLYYPSPYCAFFFTSRIVHLLENVHDFKHQPEFLLEVKERLSKAMRGKATEYLLSSAQKTEKYVSWDGTSLVPHMRFSERTANTLNDRKFISAVAFNSLINVWTTRQDGNLEWLASVPEEVQQVTKKGFCWLKNYALSRKYPEQNAFFSSSAKHHSSLPFKFPANMVQQIAGPILTSNLSGQKRLLGQHNIYAISGVPSREEYEKMLKEKNFSEVASMGFKKCYELQFPYWSAPPVTYSMICLAIAKGAALGL